VQASQHDIQSIFLQLTLLGKICEEPGSEHLVEMICPFIIPFVHMHAVGQKGTFCAWKESV